jgi:hypothetical protein
LRYKCSKSYPVVGSPRPSPGTIPSVPGDSVAASTPDRRTSGSRGRRLSAAEKVQRDRALIADRIRGLSWPVIALRHGLQERQCREIYRQWRDSEKTTLVERDPVEWLAETLDGYESIINNLASTAESADNTAARVGALKAQMDAMSRQTELLMASGLLPRNLGVIRYETDMRRAARTIVALLKQHGVGPDVLRDIQQALRTSEELSPHP